jgi:hypothetical protein
VFPPLVSPDAVLADAEAMTDRQRSLFEEAQRGQVYGTGEEVAVALEKLLARSGADEYLVTTSGFDRAALLDSYRRLALLRGLGPGGRGAARAEERR